MDQKKDKIKRSDQPYPLTEIDSAGGLKVAWENGWFDEFSDEHFIIKAIEGRLKGYPMSLIDLNNIRLVIE